MSEFQFLKYDVIDAAIAHITLNRPNERNAQNRGMLVELDTAFRRAEQDDQIRVVLLTAAGPTFSSGHDLGSAVARQERSGGADAHPSFLGNGGTRQGAERQTLQEWHFYFQNTLRWRNLRKITVAAVHGQVLAAGLMLAWCCDLIVAADDTVFADVVGTRLGMCGVEYFAHPWEFGPRKTKELMLTGDTIDVDEAYQLGMVSKVFPAVELTERAVEFAQRIAALPTMTALLIKEAVNQTMDNMGFTNALNSCFSIHQINHAYWTQVTEEGVAIGTPREGIPHWKEAPPIVPAQKSTVRATDTGRRR